MDGEVISDILTAHVSIPSLSAAALIATSVFYAIYRSYLDPLSNIPGTLVCRLTTLWAWYHSYIGDESSQIDALHKQYGPVVRIGPHEVVISNGEALAPVYSEKGGFLKAPCYANFDFEGHATIFSALDPKHRSIRSKAIMPMFSTASLRQRREAIESCVGTFIARLKAESNRSRSNASENGSPSPVNVLNLARGLAIDTVCSYLFGKNYGGSEEQTTKLSASTYVDSIVVFGGIFFLPNWLFGPLLRISLWLWSSAEGADSEQKVGGFTGRLVQQAKRDENTYQSRLLKAGISEHETDVQMKDVIFAGTDTTGTNLSILIWQLAKHPEVYKKLQTEIAQAEQDGADYDPQTLPYLNAVIREGLRTSLANPTRLPRQVPPSGWTFKPSSGEPYHLPAGTQVGLSPMTVHLNPDIFPEPLAFRPERWIDDPTPEMHRDWMPFGLGSRQCIARNLAMMELTLVVRALAKSDVLEGARPVKESIEMVEWFNAKVRDERIEVVWDG